AARQSEPAGSAVLEEVQGELDHGRADAGGLQPPEHELHHEGERERRTQPVFHHRERDGSRGEARAEVHVLIAGGDCYLIVPKWIITPSTSCDRSGGHSLPMSNWFETIRAPGLSSRLSFGINWVSIRGSR